MISGKVESSRSRAWTFRSRVRAGMRNRAHARAKTTLSKKSQNRKMGNEFIGFREICGRPDGAQKCQNTHYFRCKSVSFCISASALGGQKCEMTHFLPLKSVYFCTFGRRGGMRKSQMAQLFTVQITFPRFHGNPFLRPRERVILGDFK